MASPVSQLPRVVIAGPDPAIQGRPAAGPRSLDARPKAGHDARWELHFRLIACLFALLCMTVPALAQSPAAPAPDTAVEEPAVDPAALERIIQTVQEEPERQRLVDDLRALQAAQETAGEPADAGLAGRVIEALSAQVDMLGDSLAGAARGFAGLPEFTKRTVMRLADAPDRRRFFGQIGAVLASLLSGIVA